MPFQAQNEPPKQYSSKYSRNNGMKRSNKEIDVINQLKSKF